MKGRFDLEREREGETRDGKGRKSENGERGGGFVAALVCRVGLEGQPAEFWKGETARAWERERENQSESERKSE
eukprot:6209642-Pleurochrysis_carterae.AAC.1